MWEEFNYTLNVSEKTLPGVEKMVTTCGSAMEAATGAHAIAVMTEWDEFTTLDYKVRPVRVPPPSPPSLSHVTTACSRHR